MSKPAPPAPPTLTPAELLTLVVLLAGGVVLAALLVGRLLEARAPVGGVLTREPSSSRANDGPDDDGA